jgi:hypothetical protein
MKFKFMTLHSVLDYWSPISFIIALVLIGFYRAEAVVDLI